MIYLPMSKKPGRPSTSTLHLPADSTLDRAAHIAADVMGFDGVITYEVNAEIVAFVSVQDGTYDYNKRVSYVLDNAMDIKVALEGDVCLYFRHPTQVLSR